MISLKNIRAFFFAGAATLSLTLVGCGGGASSTGAAPGSGGGTTTSGITVALKEFGHRSSADLHRAGQFRVG